MYKVIFLLLLVMNTFYSSSAQLNIGQRAGKWDNQIFINDVNGRPIRSQYTDVEGSPYLKPEWINGTIEMKNGRKFINVPIRLDIVTQELIFISPDKQEGTISGEFIKEISFIDSAVSSLPELHFRTGFPPINTLKSNNFYQVLSDGKIALLKSIYKSINTRKNELSGEISKEFALYEDYYIFVNGNILGLKRNKEAILDLMNSQSAKMEAYFKANKPSLKNVDQLAAVFTYFNGL